MDGPGRARWTDAAPVDTRAADADDAPLARAAVVAFTLGVIGTSAAWAGIAEVETAALGFAALATGLVLAVPILAGVLLGYLRVAPEERRPRADAGWLLLAGSILLFLAAAALLDDGSRSGEVSGLGAGVAAGGELVLLLGVALGAAGRPGRGR